jgi:hypothetical protein
MRNGRSTRIESRPRKSQTVASYLPRRVCADEACSTLLSIYNAGAHCSLHEGPGPHRRNDVLREQRGPTLLSR